MKPAPKNTFRRRLIGIGAATVMLAGTGVGAGTASAQPFGSSLPELPQPPQISAPALPPLPAGPRVPTQEEFNGAVLDVRDNIHAQTSGLPGEVREPIQHNVDNAVEFIAPGALAARERARAAANAAQHAPAPTHRSTPCPKTARACVDLDGQKTWLQTNGRTTYGPVALSKGRKGQETPKGSFRVTRKVKDEISYEFNNAPMPYAVYFTNNGHAFHEGSVNTESAGCIHLTHNDAAAYFDQLKIGDEVFIY